MPNKDSSQTSRRNFLGALATGTAAISMATIAPLTAGAKSLSEKWPTNNDPDAWFNNIKGKHRIVFDATRPHEIMPFAWPRVFLMTNEMTGTMAKDNSVVVVLRHAAIPYAMEDRLWTKYNFGEVFNVEDPTTKAPAKRNPFWKPKAGDYKVPGIGNVAIGINELQDSGVMFCVCNAALTVYSAVVAEKMNQKAEDVKKDWEAGILPGIQIVPSGVWALGRAQERGCGYIFAG
ncbi:MAG: twin-arginine translocation signal domain-containing protein [Flavisolibacter sp.]|nr:twin-arginine translocation signal domain-containing protein [Flavisolibacter sp.]MBD0296413.1 twin-arginine translocation signal domain-containing protein [Flavisolibacter sp.]MBD0350341.1 twin-arginine translocation signal domain-containing protein [Flavisolibacter sp.]MBD0375843.1 twin-arginine translocation signal domain-containing protein [Flavisolibacter sp.]